MAVSDTDATRSVPPPARAVQAEIEAAYRRGLMTSPLPMLLVVEGGRILAANEEFERLLGYSEMDLHRRTVQELAHEDDRAQVLQVVQRMNAREPWRLDYDARWVAADGRVVWTRRHLFNVAGDDSRTCHVVALLEDITEERLALRQASAVVEVGRMIATGAQLSEVAQRLARAAEERWSDGDCCVMVCDEAHETLAPLAYGRIPDELFAEFGPIPVGAAGGACGQAAWRAERVEITDFANDPRSTSFAEVYERYGLRSAWYVPIVDPMGETVGSFGLLHRRRREASDADWTALETLAAVAGIAAHVERQRRVEREEALARRRDGETGLPNALAFGEQLSTWDPSAPLAVAVVRLENAAAIAAAAGTDGPTGVLRAIADRSTSLADVRLVGQVGPTVLALAVHAHWSVREAELLLRVLGKPVDLQVAEVKPQLAVGVVHAKGSPVVADELLRQAAIALPSRGVAVETGDDRPTRSMLLARSSEMDRAFRQNELVVHYQPKYSLATGEVLGCEALVRWQHPVHGLLTPADFLPALELADRGSDLLLRVVSLIRCDAPALERLGVRGRVAANLTAADVRREHVRATLTDPDEALWEVLDLELTESALVDDEGRAALHALADAGYEIALDDFGTGWSSLSVLHTLPLAAVKIDRSFIARLPHDPAVEALVRGVSATCEHLGITVIAEGIETPEQGAAARSAGCRVGQGYLFHRPTALADVNAAAADPPPPLAPAGAEHADEMRALALELFTRGASRHTIASALNRAGHRTPSGVRWHTNTVASLLGAHGLVGVDGTPPPPEEEASSTS